jgi:hypothetical protein
LKQYQRINTFFTLGTLIELEPEVKSSSKSAKTSPASLRKQVTVAEGEKASAAAIGAAVSSLTGAYVSKFCLYVKNYHSFSSAFSYGKYVGN